MEAFLKAKKSENISKGTILFYRKKLKGFTDYLETQEIRYISQLTANNIRDYLLLLEERGHNAGGIHGYYRSICDVRRIKILLAKHETHMINAWGKSPVKSGDAPNGLV